MLSWRRTRREATRDTVQRLKLREERGALIEEVTAGSSAAEAGLLSNDVIVKWDGESIESAREVSRHIRETPAGRSVRLGVIREGREIEINVKDGRAPGNHHTSENCEHCADRANGIES